MRLSAQSIRRLNIVRDAQERTKFMGMSYGLGPASYDVRIAQDVTLRPGDFILASTVEFLRVPIDVSGQVADKSSWARRGLTVFNTFIDPGWYGYLTLELKNLGHDTLMINKGAPIAQIIFDKLDEDTLLPYNGKYQNQPARPVEAIDE